MTRGEALLAWYHREARGLPWRNSADPWPILVSEVMLQQTQVGRVIPHFERFLTRFPTVASAAAATLAEVMEEWVGLGYNVRARRLHAAARLVARDGWPDTSEGLRSLPGVGDYTAAAVASIAFGEPVAAIDTNVRRVLSRWEGHPMTPSETREAARRAVHGHAGTWNQALMDLGATICRPTAPRCEECPVQRWCVDPDVYTAPRRQSGFAGSDRQVRGAVVRNLVGRSAPVPIDELSSLVDFDVERTRSAVVSLEGDAIVKNGPQGVILAETPIP